MTVKCKKLIKKRMQNANMPKKYPCMPLKQSNDTIKTV